MAEGANGHMPSLAGNTVSFVSLKRKSRNWSVGGLLAPERRLDVIISHTVDGGGTRAVSSFFSHTSTATTYYYSLLLVNCHLLVIIQVWQEGSGDEKNKDNDNLWSSSNFIIVVVVINATEPSIVQSVNRSDSNMNSGYRPTILQCCYYDISKLFTLELHSPWYHNCCLLLFLKILFFCEPSGGAEFDLLSDDGMDGSRC